MAIALACPTCAHSVNVTSEMAGRRGRCPQCRMELILPSALVELPDHGEADGALPAPRREWSAVVPWVLGIGAVLAMFVLLCGGPIAVVSYLLRGDQEAAELAQQVTVSPPGINLPAGAPPRALRVNNFAGVFKESSQLAGADVVFPVVGPKNNKRVCKEYVIDLEAGKTYVINLDAPQFDAYLRLAHLNGQPIAEDDDGGGGLNSQIQFTPDATKSYLVVATSLAGGTGPYTLTVREWRFRKPR
jgi:hypothetical protein